MQTARHACSPAPSQLPQWLARLAAVCIFLSVSIAKGEEKALTDQRAPLPSKEEIAKLPPDGGPEFNRLIFSSSPYLLQHARNPVDWYPWGDEAFERARRENKPIFLSVGYSTCYWCHVMERECFEDADVAQVLNSLYICIKVDREERPDIDSVYVTAAQLMVGSAGWPNNVWLNADRNPWYATTYVPKEDGPWGEGFISLAKRLSQKYKNERPAVDSLAGELAGQIQHLSLHQEATDTADLSRERSKELLRQLSFAFDSLRGGVGLQPKFPPHGALSFWCYEYFRNPDEKVLAKIVKTQDAIVLGGLHDHVSGGFHRYCTDQRWVLPHFEKMLYDNAQLARTLCDAWLITGNQEYRQASEDALNWCLSEMRDTDGGFFSAVDAETKGEEGAYYTFTYEEALNAVGVDDAQWFAATFNLAKEGNYLEEHTALRNGRNVLYRTKTLAQLAQESGTTEEAVAERLTACLDRLRRLRAHREYPHVDDKVLTSWNALMVGSLAYCGRHFDNPKYVSEAERCASFILNKLTEPDGTLRQSWRRGEAFGAAYLDSYAYLARALLELYQSTGDARWLAEAEKIVDGGMGRFRDAAGGGYFFTAPQGEKLIAASKSAMDDVTPSGNGVAAQVLARLHAITGKPEYETLARSTIAAFSGQIKEAPLATESMYLALDLLADNSATDGELGGALNAEMAVQSSPDASSRQAPVTVDLYLSRTQVKPGETFKAKLRIGLDPGFHVNSNSPLEDSLLPTSVVAADGSELSVSKVSYPNGEPLETAFGGSLEAVYFDGATIDLTLAAPRARTGRLLGKLQVNLQPCDEKACQLPQVHQLEFAVSVGETAGQPAHPEMFGGGGQQGRAPSPGGNAKAGLVITACVVLLAFLVAALTRRRRNRAG